MIDEAALMEKASKGARYKELLQSGEVVEALQAIERQYADAWAETFNADERENLWRAVQVTRKIKAHLNDIASDGKVASHQLAEIRRLK